MSTCAILGILFAIMPQLLVATSSTGQQTGDSLQGLPGLLLDLWIIDLVAISVSVDHVALTLSIIPFICILPTLLIISVNDSEMFLRTIILAVTTFAFIVARYIANTL
jgi:hypothetical protein